MIRPDFREMKIQNELYDYYMGGGFIITESKDVLEDIRGAQVKGRTNQNQLVKE